MTTLSSSTLNRSTTQRQAALTAAIGLLGATALAPFAYYYVFPSLINFDSMEQTFQNIAANSSLYLMGLFGFLVTFLMDLLIAWSLYVLLAPVNRALSQLAAWFRLIFAAFSVVALFNYVTLLRLVTVSDYLTLFGPEQLQAQARLLIGSFRYEWNIAFVFFAVHLALIGYLVYKSGYIPKILGVLLVINGLGYLIDSLRPYLFPEVNLSFLIPTFFGELILMVWLFIRGRLLEEPLAEPATS